ncbi:YeeE/YedE thiosulfate transporter family protein, partial [Staphylococcus epidermidis]|uniref:YeeE/YedE thiosulfate transporter family protein n=1 Tax=Staphylococcus epidermidis TaxID=1282 RepID=UPI0037D9E6AC
MFLPFLIHRTTFSLPPPFTHIYLQNTNKIFYPFLIPITLQTIPLLILNHLNIIQLPPQTFPLIPTILGAFIFARRIV